MSQKGFASILGKAKKLKREGHFPAEDFKEVQIAGATRSVSGSGGDGIILRWDKKSVIKFPEVDLLVDFLKKVG